MEGLDGCQIKLNRPLPFKWGRTDCIPDESEKWTPYDFEATKTEKHSNTYGSGNQVVDDLKGDFDLTARETISLMATHGLNQRTINFDEVTKYMGWWIRFWLYFKNVLQNVEWKNLLYWT